MGHKGPVLRPRCVGPGSAWNQIPFIHSLFFFSASVLGGGGWSMPCPGRFIPGKGTDFIRGWVGSRAGLDECAKSRPPTGFDPWTLQPVGRRYTDYTIPARLCSLYSSKIYLILKTPPTCIRPQILRNTFLSNTSGFFSPEWKCIQNCCAYSVIGRTAFLCR